MLYNIKEGSNNDDFNEDEFMEEALEDEASDELHPLETAHDAIVAHDAADKLKTLRAIRYVPVVLKDLGQPERRRSSLSLEPERRRSSLHSLATIEENGGLQTDSHFIFANGGLIVAGLNLLACAVWILSYAQGDGWRRNPTSVAWGVEKSFEESHRANQRLLNAHAFMGVTFLVMCFGQFASPILFANRHEKDTLGQFLKASHGILGRIIAVLTISTVVTGAIFALASDRYHHNHNENKFPAPVRIFFMSMLWVGGVGILVNFAIGLKQVLFVKEKTPEGMLIHKGCMFFGFFYIGQFGIIEIVIKLAQLVSSECALGTFGNVLCVFVPSLIQLVALILVFEKYDPDLLQHKVLCYNLAFFAEQAFVSFLLIPYLLVSPPENDSC